MAHPSEAASLPSEIEPNSHLVVGQVDGPTATNTTPGYEQITVCVGHMGTRDGYDMSRRDYIETGGVGCKVCWRWMRFNNYNSHQKGRKHTKNVVKRIAETTPKPVLWEIMFPEWQAAHVV
jgi:hypothetical protein